MRPPVFIHSVKEVLLRNPPKDTDHANKLILAPMVRCGTLPLRLLSIFYGADLVYGPEIIAHRLAKSKRVVNPLLGTIDFIDKQGRVDFRTIPEEKPYLVFQIGAADPDLAVQAALKVAQDVSSINLNCGCPKKFSVSGNMGAALLQVPDTLCAILKALVEKVPLPITCKIRILDSLPDTLDLIDKICSTGITALTVHVRTASERPKDAPHWDVLKPIAEFVNEKHPNVALVANGDVFSVKDYESLKESTGINAFMLARGPQWNASLFRTLPSTIRLEEPVSEVKHIKEVLREYSQLSMWYDMPVQNLKYTALVMMEDQNDKMGMSLKSSQSLLDAAKAMDIEDFYHSMIKEREAAVKENKHLDTYFDVNSKKDYTAECPYIPNAPFIPEKPLAPLPSVLGKRKADSEENADIAG